MQNRNGKLIISLEEMKKIIDYAENRCKYDCMHPSLIISKKENGKIEIRQDCQYAECNSIYHVQ